jgi:hypothetical protein
MKTLSKLVFSLCMLAATAGIQPEDLAIAAAPDDGSGTMGIVQDPAPSPSNSPPAIQDYAPLASTPSGPPDPGCTKAKAGAVLGNKTAWQLGYDQALSGDRFLVWVRNDVQNPDGTRGWKAEQKSCSEFRDDPTNMQCCRLGYQKGYRALQDMIFKYLKQDRRAPHTPEALACYHAFGEGRHAANLICAKNFCLHMPHEDRRGFLEQLEGYEAKDRDPAKLTEFKEMVRKLCDPAQTCNDITIPSKVHVGCASLGYVSELAHCPALSEINKGLKKILLGGAMLKDSSPYRPDDDFIDINEHRLDPKAKGAKVLELE